MKEKINLFRFNLAYKILPGSHKHVSYASNWRACPKCK